MEGSRLSPDLAQYLCCRFVRGLPESNTCPDGESVGVSYLACGGSQSAGQVVNLWVGRRCVAFMFGNEVVEQPPRGKPQLGGWGWIKSQ